MRFSRAAATSGLLLLMALETTSTSAFCTFSARWPISTRAPKLSSLAVTAERFRSEPDTSYPRLSSTSAMPHMLILPIPTKWMRRMRRMAGRLKVASGRLSVLTGNLQAGADHVCCCIGSGLFAGLFCHQSYCLRFAKQGAEALGQQLGGKGFLRQQLGCAAIGQVARIGCLVIINGMGQRDQQRRTAGCGQPGPGPLPRPGIHPVRPRHGPRQCLQEGPPPRPPPPRRVGLAGIVHMLATALVADLRALAGG